MNISLLKGILITVALATSLCGSVLAQRIAGLQPGDSEITLEKLGSKPVVVDIQGIFKISKFNIDGNDLSVTVNTTSKKIVYVELDWIHSPKTGLGGFDFGMTLEQIRQRNGSNGYSYTTTAMNRAGDQLITFNAYTLTKPKGVVAVFVTVLNIPELQKQLGNKKPSDGVMGKNFKLDAVILAEETYLDELWGREKIYDPKNTPIILSN